MGWFGLGKPRSKLGNWIDKQVISQTELERRSGVSRDVIRKLSNSDHKPSWKTEKKIMKAVREIDPEAKESDFWDV